MYKNYRDKPLVDLDLNRDFSKLRNCLLSIRVIRIRYRDLTIEVDEHFFRREII